MRNIPTYKPLSHVLGGSGCIGFRGFRGFRRFRGFRGFRV